MAAARSAWRPLSAACRAGWRTARQKSRHRNRRRRARSSRAVFRAARRDQRPHDAGGVVARFSEDSYGGAALIDQYVLRIGAVEIELSHVPPPVKNESRTMDSSAES